MKKLAIIGANAFQDPLIRKAKQMGFETHVFAWAAGDVGECTADVFHPISITEKEAIWDVCRQVGVEACCSVGSDLAVHTVNYVQRRLGNPCSPEITDTIATNKYAMRQALAGAGVPCPLFMKASVPPRRMCWPIWAGRSSSSPRTAPAAVAYTRRRTTPPWCRPFRRPGGSPLRRPSSSNNSSPVTSIAARASPLPEPTTSWL